MAEIKTIKSKFMKNIFDQNTYILSNDKNEAVIVDASAELEDVLSEIEGKKVLAILITHAHFDHTWNLSEYLEQFNCDVYVVEGAEERFESIRLNASFMVRKSITQNISKKLIKYYAKKLKIGDFEFEITFTPGHTSDGVCILWKDNLFTGDTIFADGVGRTDLDDSNPFELKNSLEKIKSINYTVAYPGHYESAIKHKIDNVIDYYL